jgi:hypothetical protein
VNITSIVILATNNAKVISFEKKISIVPNVAKNKKERQILSFVGFAMKKMLKDLLFIVSAMSANTR